MTRQFGGIVESTNEDGSVTKILKPGNSIHGDGGWLFLPSFARIAGGDTNFCTAISKIAVKNRPECESIVKWFCSVPANPTNDSGYFSFRKTVAEDTKLKVQAAEDLVRIVNSCQYDTTSTQYLEWKEKYLNAQRWDAKAWAMGHLMAQQKPEEIREAMRTWRAADSTVAQRWHAVTVLLKPGMPFAEIKKMLGEPKQFRMTFVAIYDRGVKEGWEYRFPDGSVKLYTDDWADNPVHSEQWKLSYPGYDGLSMPLRHTVLTNNDDDIDIKIVPNEPAPHRSVP